MRRPFVTRYSPNQPPGTLEVRIRFKSPIDVESSQIVEAARDKFIDLANSGALCGENIEPHLSSIGPARALISESATTWTFSKVRIDPFSLSILVNMVHYIHDKFVPVSELDVSWSHIAQLKNPAKAQFPEPYEPLPFAFDYDDSLASFDIVVDFAVPQKLDHVEEVEGIVGMWFSAANLGAYGDESSLPSINQIYFSPEVSTLSEESIVWHIDRFSSGPQAIDGLVNVIAKIHRTHAPIQSLEISE